MVSRAGRGSAEVTWLWDGVWMHVPSGCRESGKMPDLACSALRGPVRSPSVGHHPCDPSSIYQPFDKRPARYVTVPVRSERCLPVA